MSQFDLFAILSTLRGEPLKWTQPFNIQDVPFAHLTAILEFMYAGEVNVAQDQLPSFLKTAEKLKIKGLAEGTQGSTDGS